MKRLFLAAIIFVLCLVIILPANIRAQDSSQSSEAPYLYYFSSDIDAVVIERADGTDTRVLGEGLFEQIYPYNYVPNSEWSASGDWLAWTVEFTIARYGTFREMVPYIVSVDGTQHRPINEQFFDIDFRWSPSEDKLLMWGSLLSYAEDGVPIPVDHQFVMVYDVGEGRKILQADDIKETLGIDSIRKAEWSSDGDYIFLERRNYPDQNPTHIVLSKDGELVNVLRDVDAVNIGINYYYDYYYESRYGSKIVQFHSETGLTVTDLITSEEKDIVGIQEKPELFLFNQDQQQALIVEKGVWLWSVEEGLTLLLNETEFSETAVTDPDAIFWSPSNNYALIYGHISEDEAILWSIDARKRQVHQIWVTNGESQDWSNRKWHWTGDSQALVIGLVDKTRGKDDYFNVHRYSLEIDLSSMATSEIDFVAGSHNSIAFNDEVSVLATVDDGPVIYHRADDKTLILRPDYDSYFSLRGGFVSLDRSGRWLLSKEEGLVSGGGSKIGHVGISQIDGTHRRDLTHLHHFAEWLPPQVDTWQDNDGIETLVPDPIEPWKNYQILAVSEHRSLAAIMSDKLESFFVYDLDSQTQLREIGCSLEWYIFLGYNSSFSPDGNLLACHNAIFDVTTGEKLADIPITGTAFAFSPDGTQLAVAASWDVLIYDVAELLEWKSAKHNFAAHSQ